MNEKKEKEKDKKKDKDKKDDESLKPSASSNRLTVESRERSSSSAKLHVKSPSKRELKVFHRFIHPLMHQCFFFFWKNAKCPRYLNLL